MCAMDRIDISRKIIDFKHVLDKESRIIFSAKFGDGKSFFLNEFMNSCYEMDNKYYFITLHPINYVVEENRDIIEYIKRDILFQLVKDEKIYDFEDGYEKIFDAVCNKDSLLKLANFTTSIIPVHGLKKGYEALQGLITTIREKYKNQNVLYVVDDYINGFYGKKGCISECDAFTYLIQKSLEQMYSKSVLIIEDLDRIDPAHMFRIINILSSQIDNPYYSDSLNGNKFGFDKIILVMDYDITKHIFHHFYSKEANYEGYINKFLNTMPFRFSITSEAQKLVERKLVMEFNTQNILNLAWPVFELDEEVGVLYIKEAIRGMSVRRCKEFLEDDLFSHVKDKWQNQSISIPTRIDFVKMLYCLRCFTLLSDEKIFDLALSNLDGEIALRLYLPLFYQRTNRSFIYVKKSNSLFICRYNRDSNEVSVDILTNWSDSTTIDFKEIKECVWSMKQDVLDLLIG